MKTESPDSYSKLPVIAGFLALSAILVLFFLAATEYRGRLYIYGLFSVLANLLLYLGLRRDAIFFDTFIGVLLWLGFWLKLTVRVAFLDGRFRESVGFFDGSGAAFDDALLAAICGFAGLIAANYLRRKYCFVYPGVRETAEDSGLARFYRNHRTLLLFGFVCAILAVAVTNAWLGIYQRGTMTQTVLPYGMNGIFKWLLLFGLASVSALMLNFEYLENKGNSFTVSLLAIFETFASSVSLLSRGMVLNASALGFGLYRGIRIRNLKLNYRLLAVSALAFVVLFGTSIVAVNYYRSANYHQDSGAAVSNKKVVSTTAYETGMLFLDRWVGIEGVLAVSSYPEKNWALFRDALSETYAEDRLSFYDQNLINSQYKEQAFERYRFISLPGIVAFAYYPGSFLFLFFAMFGAGLFAFAVEYLVYRLGNKNIVLCALMGQVVAYRYTSFGYVPLQSYLLFGSIFVNVILIFGCDRLLALWYRRKSTKAP